MLFNPAKYEARSHILARFQAVVCIQLVSERPSLTVNLRDSLIHVRRRVSWNCCKQRRARMVDERAAEGRKHTKADTEQPTEIVECLGGTYLL